MKLDINKSMVSDTIQFFNTYFNYNRIKQNIVSQNLSTYNEFKFYNIVKEKIILKPSLYSLFDLSYNQVSVIDNIFFDHFKEINSLDDFIAILRNKKLIINSLSSYYWNEKIEIKDNTIPENEVFKLNINANIKLSLGLIVNSYDEIINQLISQFKTVYGYIKDIFQQNDAIFKIPLKKKYISALTDTYKHPIGENTVYCVSLISSYNIRCHLKNNDYIWFLGHLCHRRLEKENALFHVNYQSVAALYSNEVLIDILKIIKDHPKINTANILKLLPYEITNSTAYRLISNLLIEKAIFISEKIGVSIYYSINEDYFKKAALVMDEATRYYYDKKSKEDEL